MNQYFLVSVVLYSITLFLVLYYIFYIYMYISSIYSIFSACQNLICAASSVFMDVSGEEEDYILLRACSHVRLMYKSHPFHCTGQQCLTELLNVLCYPVNSLCCNLLEKVKSLQCLCNY